MELKVLPDAPTVCKVADLGNFDMEHASLYFIGRTDEELSLVCRTQDVPAATLEREDGWRALRIQGVLDFSLIGILSRISGLLAQAGIGIFAVSTYNTDYILTRQEAFDRALEVLSAGGYAIV